MPYSTEQLEALRAVGDPPADQVIAEIVSSGKTDEVSRLLHTLIRNDQRVPPELPDGPEAWLRESGALPAWADPARLERASALFAEHGPLISLILGTASLVNCYACKKGVKVLTFTYRLEQEPYRRVGETAQFLIDVMAPGGLSPAGAGIRAIQKVRLLHAAIRSLILASGRWDTEGLGAPICQEDLLGTLMTFSATVVEDLRKLGVAVSPRQAEDFLHHWKVVGALLGVREEILPAHMPEAEAVTRMIFRRHQGRSPDGIRMTRALLEMWEERTPGRLFDGAIPAILRLLVGDKVADWMQVPVSGWDRLIGQEHMIARLLHLFRLRSPLARWAIGRLSFAFLSWQVMSMSGHRRAEFDIPAQLRQAWGMGPPKAR